MKEKPKIYLGTMINNFDDAVLEVEKILFLNKLG